MPYGSYRCVCHGCNGPDYHNNTESAPGSYLVHEKTAKSVNSRIGKKEYGDYISIFYFGNPQVFQHGVSHYGERASVKIAYDACKKHHGVDVPAEMFDFSFCH